MSSRANVDEFMDSLKEMVNDISPRQNGYMGKFYKATWVFIGPDLL
jgi:hypothetical protein